MLVFITSADIEHPLKEMRTEEYRHTALWMKEKPWRPLSCMVLNV